MRLKLFNVDVEGGAEALSPDGKYYKVCPQYEARIRVKGQDVPEEALQYHTELNI